MDRVRRMKRGRGRLVVLLTVGSVLWVGGSGDGFATQRGFERDPGESAMNRSCLSCHDLRPIQTHALDRDGWTSMIGVMVSEQGAEVDPGEIPAMASYLAETYGPVPEGEGKAILLNNCTICHNRERILGHAGDDRDRWATTLQSMLNEGAFLTDEEFATLLDYLAEDFAP